MDLDDHDRVEVRSRAELRSWLADHHRDKGVFLVTWKAHTDHYLPWGEIVQELLAWGWVDSTGRGVDADRTSHLISPRRRGSAWSRINKEHVEELEAAGLMTTAGRAVIEAARADGSWTILDEVEQGIVPDDFAVVLAARDARQQWDELPWITTARRDETRTRRIASAAEITAAGGRLR